MDIAREARLHRAALTSPSLEDHVNKLGETGLPINIDKRLVDSCIWVKHLILIGGDNPDGKQRERLVVKTLVMVFL